jgi:hypothetical protein
MKIKFRRSGGHLPLELSASVATDQLPAADASELEWLVASAGLREMQTGAPGALPDAYMYRLSTTFDDGSQHEVELSEVTVPPRLRPLIRWLTSRATADAI